MVLHKSKSLIAVKLEADSCSVYLMPSGSSCSFERLREPNIVQFFSVFSPSTDTV